jgi:hypothetical protein
MVGLLSRYIYDVCNAPVRCSSAVFFLNFDLASYNTEAGSIWVAVLASIYGVCDYENLEAFLFDH